MGAPKSVTKISKNGVEYTSNVDACQYYIFELTRAALRDVGKYLASLYKKSLWATFKKLTGNAGKGVKYSVWSSKNTLYPRVDVGIKSGVQYYGPFQELGSSKTKRYGILQKEAEDHIAKIVEIESQYLSGLSEEASRLNSLIDENEYEGGDEDEG